MSFRGFGVDMESVPRLDTKGLPTEVAETLTDFEHQITTIEQIVAPMLATPMKEIAKKLTPLEKAKFNIAMAYFLNALFYMYLRVQGVDPSTHPVSKEMDRVKNYLLKLNTEQTKAVPNPFPVDQAAAKRFIAAGLSSPSTTIKATDEPETKKKKRKSSETAENTEPEKKKKKRKSETSIENAEPDTKKKRKASVNPVSEKKIR